MDEALLPYLQATSEAEKQECLDDLLLVHASPVVRNVLRERLGFYLSPKQFTSRSREAEDLYHEILAKIVELLRALETTKERPDIRSFRRYVARIATNTCHDYLRQKSPARARLKNNLRDLLNRHPDFALWKVDDEWFAGFAAWPATKPAITSSQRDEVESRLQVFRGEMRSRIGREVSISRVVAELFQFLDASIELNLLVDFMARVLDVKDHPPESLDDESRRYLENRLTETTFSIDLRLDAKDKLMQFWEAVQTLPSKQRDTFCFGFSDQSGEDLFSLLIDDEVASLEEIARALGRSEAELAELWQAMPLDRNAIAALLNATPPQVSKWRHRAVERLERKMFPPK